MCDSEEEGKIKGKGLNRFVQGAVGNVIRPSYIDEQSLKGLNRTEMLQVRVLDLFLNVSCMYWQTPHKYFLTESLGRK